MDERSLRVLEFSKIKEIIKAYTQTAAAKELIEELVPYSNVYEIRERLQETKEAVELLMKKGSPPFEGIHDVREGIFRAEKAATLGSADLYRIGGLLRVARRFKDYVAHKEDEEAFLVLEDICEGLVPLKRVEDEIFNAILDENEISDRASETLFNIRRELKNKNGSIRDKVNELVKKNSKFLQENLYTIRGDRYVIPVKAEHKGAVPGIVHDQSSSGATLFIEPMSLVQLNNEIRELMLREKAEVERILAQLSKKVHDNIAIIKNNSKIIWKLDFIFAKAKYGSEIRGTCPIISEDGSFYIIEARHPLINPEVVVPSTIYLGGEYTSLIITGPNTGGKTVTLKTVGLLQIMGMSGLLIPAKDNSVISCYDSIYADIGDEQSIEQSLSTFSSHMKNIVYIMDKATEKSLVLFDEIGAGTDPVEGAALAAAILENLRARKTKILATTHYSELKGYALNTPHVENASVEFDVETLKPTYRLLIGIPGKSNAFEISRRLGLKEEVIEAAKENVSSNTLLFEDLIMKLQKKSIEAENNARETAMLKAEVAKLKEKYEQKLYNIQKNKDNIVQNAQREAKSIIKAAKEEADEIAKNIRELERMGYDNDVRSKIEEQRRRLKERMENLESNMAEKEAEKGKKLKAVVPGQEVLLASLNQKVIVQTMPDSKGDLQVQAGIMKITVNISDLRAIEEGKTSSKQKISKREVNLNLRRAATSIDLRGLDAEEAIYNVDKYLDDAYMAGLNEVTIIHGKGTGILRKAIGDLLKRHSHVKSYRLGEYSEGGSGATVVVLK
ncbi:endonuclease MutS2 [Clostridium thermarum]|uniref:endonuclease MutS2 n=1 Tax=Clostridium thermarum TaxID=1716543 RepID=UPI00111D8A21|nr:endonuclease MutS2 [Clostridium thermarum]